jgi:carbamoyltransferase
VNDWLNERLQRSEFMPFAPITLYEHRDACYQRLEGAEHAARFMTVTFDCTAEMRRQSPAAVHVDGTARPQLVEREISPGLHEILCQYQRRTGLPSLINTSFNMHEEPIVATASDAIRTFLQGHLDYLALEDFLLAAPGRTS